MIEAFTYHLGQVADGNIIDNRNNSKARGSSQRAYPVRAIFITTSQWWWNER